MQKVFILAEGGHNKGFGHITRCISFYQSFEEKAIVPEFIVNGDNSVIDLLKYKNHLIFDWVKEKNRLLKFLEDADIVILDSYLANIEIYKKISRLVRVPVYLDDNKRLNYPKGIVVNGAVYAEDLGYPKREDIAYLLGTKYQPLRKEFWNVPKKNIKDNLESVMVTFGGDDIRNLTPPILKMLNKNFSHLIKNVVIGKGFKNIQEIKKLSDYNTNLFYYPSAEGMKSLMLKSDIAISACGQTLYELASIGVPTIAISIINNQKNNIRSWQKAGFIQYAGSWDDKSIIRNTIKALMSMQSRNIRIKKSKIGKIFVDGKGSLRIADFVLKKKEYDYGNKYYIRKAGKGDIKEIFNLSNDPLVRNNSINLKKVIWNDHVDWFDKKIRDKDYIFYVVFDHENKFIGQVRYEISKNIAIVSISITEQFRGKKFSTPILIKTIDMLIQERKDINNIHAFIRPNNNSSIKSFEKAGYSFSKNVEINGEKFLLFILNLDY